MFILSPYLKTDEYKHITTLYQIIDKEKE